jgi:hypothetical protein
MITELKLKEVSEELNNLSFEQVGDDHLCTGLLTPMKKDAFKLSDEEKKHKIENLFSEIMDVMGLDLTDDSLRGTPKRVAKMYIEEIFSGLNPANKPKIALFDNKYQYNQMLVEKNITFYSNCEHHFVPIIGKSSRSIHFLWQSNWTFKVESNCSILFQKTSSTRTVDQSNCSRIKRDFTNGECCGDHRRKTPLCLLKRYQR